MGTPSPLELNAKPNRSKKKRAFPFEERPFSIKTTARSLRTSKPWPRVQCTQGPGGT
ncbi:protein of unknown function [Aminobacter niigataensis]|nr:protein of unknown function [Aminobacter niigataensis]